MVLGRASSASNRGALPARPGLRSFLASRVGCTVLLAFISESAEISRDAGPFTGLTRALGWADAKKGNHWPRRMGCHGSVGNGAGRARAASTATPTARPYGRY